MTGVELSPLWIILSEVAVDYTNAADNDNGQFQEGNANIGLKGTVVDAAWLNAVQTEIVTPIIDNGIALSRNDDGQLYKAINKYIYDKKFNRVLFQEVASDTVTIHHSHVFQTISCPPKSFIDCDVFVHALNTVPSAGTMLIRVYADEHGAGGDSCDIEFLGSGLKREMHRLVLVNNSESNQKFSISCGTISSSLSFDVDMTISGYIDFFFFFKG